MVDIEIRSLTAGEEIYLIRALETLQRTSATGTSDNWAAVLMLENDGEFVKKLLFMSKGKQTI